MDSDHEGVIPSGIGFKSEMMANVEMVEQVTKTNSPAGRLSCAAKSGATFDSVALELLL
jgi:hypothetical protein